MTPAPAGSVAYRNPKITDGWRYLLPPLIERKVLCLSARPSSLSASQASLYGELTLLHDTRLDGIPPMPEPSTAGEAGKLKWQDLQDLLGHDGPLPEEQQFDGFVLHDPEAVVLHRGNLPRLLQLLRHLPALLRRGAFVYLGARNPYSPAQFMGRFLRRDRQPGHRLVSVRTVLNALHAVGFADTRTHAFLAWGATLAEVIPQRGYRASKNRERLGETIKEFVYGRLGSQALAPAYGIVAFIEPSQATESCLDLVTKHVARAPFYRGDLPIVVKNYLLFSGSKAIITLGPEGRDDQDVVAVLTTDTLVIERRSIEVEVLSKLARLPQPLARFIPVALDQFSVGQARCYLLNRLPGVTLDLNTAALDHVTEQALEFVIELHRASPDFLTIDEPTYRTHFWTLVEAAQERNPAVSDELRAWDAPLRTIVMGAKIRSVWMHGDYKVENVMYDQRQRKLTGVIDWELARNLGLPLLDPLYLLIYNRLIRGGSHIEVLAQMLWLDQRTGSERSLLRRYLDGVGVSEALVPALCAMFVAHHVGCRMHFPSDNASTERLRSVIHATGSMLERSAASARSIPHE